MAKRPSNLTIIENADLNQIVEKIQNIKIGSLDAGVFSGHFTNGTYVAPKEVVVPTTLTGFQHVIDIEIAQNSGTDINTPIGILVNSRESMEEIMRIKGASDSEIKADRFKSENQKARAEKVGIPVALQFPEHPVFVAFYDDVTPTNLYGTMAGSWIEIKTLHKWGYGTNPKAGAIEGADSAEKVYAHPLPNDAKPLCDDITRRAKQENINIVDLRKKTGPHESPYITDNNECLFPLNKKLEHYGVIPKIPYAHPLKCGFDHG